MMEANTTPSPEKQAAERIPRGARANAIIVLICVFVICAGAAGAFLLVRSAPAVKKRPPQTMTPLVRIQSVLPADQTIVIEATGTVVPATQLMLKSRVGGEIVFTHPEFVQGGIVRRGEELIRIDDQDYTLAIARKKSAVADARFALTIEEGRQDVARREWALLNGDRTGSASDAELALRKPHLEKAQADLAAAMADLAAAELELERTRITAPFNAVIRETHVEKGSQVAAQETLATLVGTDTYWVEVAVPIDRLQWITIPDVRNGNGAPVRIAYHGGAQRKGQVIRLRSDLESEGRMARLLVSVSDPLGLSAGKARQPAMLIGEYVRVDIIGKTIPSAYRIPRTAIRDDSHIWLVDATGRLEIRRVAPVWRDRHSVIVQSGLNPGARIIVSDLAAPVAGMAVTIEPSGEQTAAPAPDAALPPAAPGRMNG